MDVLFKSLRFSVLSMVVFYVPYTHMNESGVKCMIRVRYRAAHGSNINDSELRRELRSEDLHKIRRNHQKSEVRSITGSNQRGLRFGHREECPALSFAATLTMQ